MDTFNNENEKEIEALRTVRSSFTMSEEEKAAMRVNLFTYMQQHPVRSKRKKASAWFFFTFPVPVRVLQSASMLVAVFFVISASTAVAAEQTLPGDTLYPLKVNVTEPLRGLLAVSAEGRAHWQASLVDRRLEEATELSVQGRLDDKKAAALSDKITISVERAENEASKLNKRGRLLAAVDVQSKVAASLGARAKVFARVKTTNESDDQEYVEPFVGAIRVRAEAAGIATAKTSATIEQGSTMPSVRLVAQKKKVAERKIAAARELLERRSIDASAHVDAESTITAAVASFQEGDLALSTNMNGKAYVKFQEAEGLAEQASAIIRASQRLRGRLTLPDEQRLPEEREDSTSQQQNETSTPTTSSTNPVESLLETTATVGATVGVGNATVPQGATETPDSIPTVVAGTTVSSEVTIDDEEENETNTSIRALIKSMFTSSAE